MKNSYFIALLLVSTFSIKCDLAEQLRNLFNPEQVRLEEETKKAKTEADYISKYTTFAQESLSNLQKDLDSKEDTAYIQNIYYQAAIDGLLNMNCAFIAEDIKILLKIADKSSSNNKETCLIFLKNLHTQLKLLSEKNNSAVCPQALDVLSKIFDNK